MSNGRIVGLVAVLVAACHGDPTPAPQPKPAARAAPAPVKPGPTAEELTAGMVEAVTLGKSTVPVAVKFDLGSRPVIGQPLEVVVAVLPQLAAVSATLQAVGGEGLQLAAATGAPIEITSVEAGQVYRLTLSVTPTSEGVHLLALNVSLNHEDTSEMRSFSVPIIVATSADVAPGVKH